MKKKNVILIVVDQLRFDSLGINGNKYVSTPNLNDLASRGYNYVNTYSATPSCIPARASLLTGLKPENHGRVGYEDNVRWDYSKTIASTFAENGYYCKCIGKMHVYPTRKLCGFHHIELHDGYLHANRKYSNSYQEQFNNSDDYLDWLKDKLGHEIDLIDLGLDCNSWVARPWNLEERYHPTNWVVTRGIDFLRKRDRDMPFFLKLSFVRPHSPLDPPKYYFDMYMDLLKDVDDITIGKWVKNDEITYSTVAKKGKLNKEDLRRALAGYYGLITHIDHQIGRFLISLEEHNLLEDTVIAFISDHGDQMGEHNLLRKAYPYQGSIHVPFIVYDKDHIKESREIDEIVELRDIFPTLIDFGIDKKVEGIDGKSIKSCKKIHEYIHGEHELGIDSSQFILTKKYKYIWFSQTGVEQLFDLSNDINEEINLINNKKYEKIKEKLKAYLIESLKNREEGYVKNNNLVKNAKAKTTLDFLKS